MNHHLLVSVKNAHSEEGLVAVALPGLLAEISRLVAIVARFSLAYAVVDWFVEAVPASYLPWDPDNNADDPHAQSYDNDGYVFKEGDVPSYEKIVWPNDEERFRLDEFRIHVSKYGFFFQATRKHDDTYYDSTFFDLDRFTALVENLPVAAR